ncbi:hypothetical protein C8J56DRAFT_886681 [Mycena floridula]|nr:hypothetical protein C8J56DRAFT_886681 [Mycena floridula]
MSDSSSSNFFYPGVSSSPSGPITPGQHPRVGFNPQFNGPRFHQSPSQSAIDSSPLAVTSFSVPLNLTPESAIDPTLLNMPTQGPTVIGDQSDDDNDDDDGETSSGMSTPTKPARRGKSFGNKQKDRTTKKTQSSSSATGKPRIYASKTHAAFGFVEGPRIGKDAYVLHRTNALTKPSLSAAVAPAARFKRLFDTLIRKAEQAAYETSGWIYMIGSHPGVGHDFLQYSSPQLRKDGGPAMVKAHNSLASLFFGLRVARRHQAIQLGLQLAEKEKEKEMLKQRLAELEAASSSTPGTSSSSTPASTASSTSS